LISRVKTEPLPRGIQKASADVVLSSRFSASSEQAGSDIPNVAHWFQPDVRQALGSIVESIRSQAPPRAHDFLFAALSSIIVRVSNQESDTRYAAISKAVTADDVFVEFEASCDRLQMALAARDYPLTACRIIAEDTLEVDPEAIGRNVGLMITSPPYPNAYEYWLYHKYRMWWLGYDPIEVREQEIGARPHFFKKNHQTEDDFSLQMMRVFGLLRQVLVSGGHACFVIGRSKIHGRLIDNAALLCDAAAAHGMRLVYQRERVIRSDRKSFNLSHAKIKTETVLVFRAD
jgi:site-specific DNA-methyltransferase (cytosine-N4-specific)